MEIPLAVGLDEGGVHRHRLALYNAALHQLPHEPVYDAAEPLGADSASEPGELGRVVGPLTVLYVADLPESRVVPQPSV